MFLILLAIRRCCAANTGCATSLIHPSLVTVSSQATSLPMIQVSTKMYLASRSCKLSNGREGKKRNSIHFVCSSETENKMNHNWNIISVVIDLYRVPHLKPLNGARLIRLISDACRPVLIEHKILCMELCSTIPGESNSLNISTRTSMITYSIMESSSSTTASRSSSWRRSRGGGRRSGREGGYNVLHGYVCLICKYHGGVRFGTQRKQFTYWLIRHSFTNHNQAIYVDSTKDNVYNMVQQSSDGTSYTWCCICARLLCDTPPISESKEMLDKHPRSLF